MPTIRSRLLRASTSILAAAVLASCATTAEEDSPFVLTIVGTNDIHGQILPAEGRGGMAAMSGYVEALRATRDEVLLIDTGDMWQGTFESNINEGAAVTEIFNEMGFIAAAVGNHEFDFGPVGEATIPAGPDDDPRGADLRALSVCRAPLGAEAHTFGRRTRCGRLEHPCRQPRPAGHARAAAPA